MHRKKILFLISSLKFGGAEKQTVDLVNHLDRSRIAITLCYFVRGQDLMAEVRLENLEGVHCLEKKMKFDIRALKRLREIVASTQPETVVCVNLYPSLYAHLVRLSNASRFKIIQIMHTTIMRSRFEHHLTRFLYAPLANRCEKVVFVCKKQMEYWCEHFGISQRKSSYVYNGIDTGRFADRLTPAEKEGIRRRYGIDSKDLVICICAALRPEKRHVDLIDAGRILVGKGLPVKILVVGGGGERDAIERHVYATGMAEHMVMTGFQADVRPFVAASDIFVIASSSVETFSIAILEAMAMGKAIVAPNIGGVSEQVLDGENGFLFPAGDIAALADRIERIVVGGVALEMGRKSRMLVSERFTIEKMVDGYKEILVK